MLVSIVITSYNYGRFLREAIDSALAQTYPEVEVVVVDDESTDDSRQIIESYGSTVVPVLKKNGGHSSSINAGFAACRGDVVCPLDSDDAFTADKVERVVDAWKARPGAHLAYHQLQTIGADGRRLGGPWPRAVWSGDISKKIARSGGWWPRPTTSGLSFSRAYLDRVLPMPTGPRIWPDTYLAPPAAMLAPVIGVPARLGFYRSHGENTILKYFPDPRGRSDRRELARRRVEQYLMENGLFVECLHRLLDHPPAVTLEAHPEFQRARREAGDPVSLWQVVAVVARCPTMTPAMRLRALARMALGG